MFAVRVWILLSALLVTDGWILSALHALNLTAYVVSFVATIVLVVCVRPKFRGNVGDKISQVFRKSRHRFKRLAPLSYLIIFLLSLISGLIRLPNNWDTDAYRIPRMLHWLAAGHWHWIHTADSRMNIAGANFEWLFAPFFLFIGNDRWLFLINLVSYACLPGLIFALFRSVGVAGRTAWWWTWILASGWCFAQQACSVTNDSMGAVYALAGIVFALRASQNGNVRDLWISVLAMALLTGEKQTNLPLMLPWVIAAWPARRLVWQRPTLTLLVVALGLLISAAPAIFLNFKYVGTWSGFPKGAAAQNLTWGRQQELTSPIWGLIGNAFCFPAQNFEPPFFPLASAWNAAMQRFLHSSLGTHFTQFENFGHLDRSVNAGNAGLGLGVAAIAIISIFGAWRYRLKSSSLKRADWSIWLVRLAPWICLLAFLAKVGTYQNARQAAPYYVLLFPLILALPGHATLVRQRWWQVLVVMMLALTVAHISFIRGRAFLPPSLVTQLQTTHPTNKFLSVFKDYYTANASVDAQRTFLQTNGLAGETLVGYAAACGASEPGMWLPFGSRRIERVIAGDSPETLRSQNMHYVVLDDSALSTTSQTMAQWIENYRGETVSQLTCQLNPADPPLHLYLIHLKP